MSHILHSSHTEKLGVAEVERVCAKSRMIFRRTAFDDVGIDGLIELVENGSVTGVLAGVQIKSGDSFVNVFGNKFNFKSDQEHFGYWARCSFPVIGVVYSPKFEKAVWLDLTSLSTDDRIANGPYLITLEYTEETAFTPENLVAYIVPIILHYTHQRRTLWQIRELLKPQRQQSSLVVPSLEVNSEKEIAWHQLIDTLLASDSSNNDVADAGYRLSWYFPAVSLSLQQGLVARLESISDFNIVRILCVIYDLLNQEATSTAELITDLFKYVPTIAQRIEQLIKKHWIPNECLDAAIQVIEVIEQEDRSDLRSM